MSKMVLLLTAVFVLLALAANFLATRAFPKIPGDILIEKPGFRIYIPITSTIIVTIICSILFGSILK